MRRSRLEQGVSRLAGSCTFRASEPPRPVLLTVFRAQAVAPDAVGRFGLIGPAWSIFINHNNYRLYISNYHSLCDNHLSTYGLCFDISSSHLQYFLSLSQNRSPSASTEYCAREYLHHGDRHNDDGEARDPGKEEQTAPGK